MCLGGHLAYRCALDSRVKAAVCYFATDIHSKTLGQGKNDDSLERAGDIQGELLMVGFFLSCLLFSGVIDSAPRNGHGISFRNNANPWLPG